MSNICAGIGRGQMTVVDQHLKHHKHVQALYEELLKDVPGVHVHRQISNEELVMSNGNEEMKKWISEHEDTPVYDSNYWLCTVTIDENVRVRGQEDAYKTIVTGAVGGAAGVIHAAASAHTDCEPNANVEAMRVALDRANIEARPVWKPMHRQPCYCAPLKEKGEMRNEELSDGVICQTSASSVAYINGVSEAIFKVGMCLPAGPYVTDDDVRYIADTIKANIIW
jgi:dTDP-4-amino-4,6-dideoxygalactose transaminase